MARKPIDFKTQVQRKLLKKPQSSAEIAAKLGMATPYGAAKVREALKQLAAEHKAVHSGAYRTSRYAKP